jgi:hypothetical protein
MNRRRFLQLFGLAPVATIPTARACERQAPASVMTIIADEPLGPSDCTEWRRVLQEYSRSPNTALVLPSSVTVTLV